MFVENEATSAATRQHPSQQSVNIFDGPYQSQIAQARFAPENRFSGQTPDTSRLYHDQMAQIHPNHPANYQPAVSKKSGALKWILITLACVALVSGAISAMVISAIRAQREVSVETAPARRVDPPSPPQAPPPPPSIGGSPLEQYKYPNAKVEKTVKVVGNEIMEMTTSDNFSEVSEYYKKRFGDPMVEDGENSAVFRIPGAPTTIITINQEENSFPKTEIKVVRTNLQIPIN